MLTDADLYVCPVTKWTIMPIRVVTCDFGIVAFYCPCCDSAGHGRTEVMYGAAHPGLHYIRLVPGASPAVWQGRQVVT